LKKIVILSLILFSYLYADEVTLTFYPISSTQVDIFMTNDVEVKGFQFDITGGIDITNGSGGSAEANGFYVTAAGSTVIGFSLSGSTIPISSAPVLLSSITFDEPNQDVTTCFDWGADLCINMTPAGCLEFEVGGSEGGSISNESGEGIPTNFGDCFDFAGCTEENAENTSSYAIFDDESCSCYGADCLDCAGNIGGEAILNGCETCICNGETALSGYSCEEIEDCIEGCDGQFYNNGNAPEYDSCDMCDGDGTSCLPVEIQFSDVIIADSLLSIQITNHQLLNNINFQLSNLQFTSNDIDSSNPLFPSLTFTGDGLFAFSNTSLEAGTHTLITFKYTPLDPISCISEVSIYDSGYDLLEIDISEDCVEIAISGCTDEDYCNYNSESTYDDGSCANEEDCVGVCGGDDFSCSDCAGELNGDSWESDCGCVAADNSGDVCDDCEGTPNGSAVVDNCDVCDDDTSNDCVQDCVGVWGGYGAIENYECDGSCAGNIVKDGCGLCGGDNSLCIPSSSNHLLLSRISTLPDEGEFITIKNTSDESISLKNHFLTDDKNYYKIQSESKQKVNFNDFIVRFPDNSLIDAGDSINICLSSQYSQFLPSSFDCDYILQEDLENIFTEGNSFGDGGGERLSDAQEMVALFYWDGDRNHPVRDIDYFVWGNHSSAMNKSDSPWYYPETLSEEQDFFIDLLPRYYSYKRISNDELETIGLNGYLGQDETSEPFNITWEIQPISGFIFGCTESDSPNYNSNASADDGTCFSTIYDVQTNCVEEDIPCQGKYDLPANNTCPLYGQKVTLIGTVVDFYDITPSAGPFSFTIEDDYGYRISFVVWPSNSIHQDGFNILESSLAELTVPPFNQFIIKITGELDVYCRSENNLNIYSDWQILVEYETDIEILETLGRSGDFEVDTSIENISIDPAPFVIIPSLGETLDFSFTVLKETRAIVRIFDLSGRFITSLADDYHELSGKISHEEGLAPWDGRDELGQIVSPGTYIMHLEVFNPATGETWTDAAPIVVGVKN